MWCGVCEFFFDVVYCVVVEVVGEVVVEVW